MNRLLLNLNATNKNLDSKIKLLDFSTNINYLTNNIKDITNVVNGLDNKIENHLNHSTFKINQLDYFIKDNKLKILNHVTVNNNYINTHP